jgi:hypothetical protein
MLCQKASCHTTEHPSFTPALVMRLVLAWPQSAVLLTVLTCKGPVLVGSCFVILMFKKNVLSERLSTFSRECVCWHFHFGNRLPMCVRIHFRKNFGVRCFDCGKEEAFDDFFRKVQVCFITISEKFRGSKQSKISSSCTVLL